MKGNRFSKAPQKTRKPKVAPKEMTTTTTTTTTGLSKMSGVDLSASGIDPSISSGSSGGLNIQLPRTKVRFFGTTWYASRDGLKGKDQGRKDDIECWYYTLRHIFDPVDGIPWKEYRKKNDVIKMLAAKQKIFDAKNSTNEKFHFFEGFNLILVHIDEMYFSACPDYEHIRSVIRAVLERKGLRIEDLYKDGVWVGKLNANRLKAVSNNVENFSDLGSDEPDSAAVY